MSSSPNLGITLLSSSQSSKYVTVNDAIDLLDEALCGRLAIAMTDADYTFASSDALGNMVFVFTGTLTAGRNVIVPTNKKLYVVSNQTTGGFSLTVKTSGGTGIALSTTDYVLLYCDGTNVIALNVSGGASSSLAGDSDVTISGTADGQVLTYISGSSKWENVAPPFSVSLPIQGVGVNGEKWFVPITTAVKFPSGAANSVAKAATAATGSTTYTFKKNGTSFATVAWSASGTTGTWTQASDATFAAGDMLEIDGPATADATLADIGITLAGVRT